MGKAIGQVKFSDAIKFFIYNSTEDICKPKLYDTFYEMLDNWDRLNGKLPICNHQEEPVEIYQNYGGGFYWRGTACRKCNIILKGIEPLELPIDDRYDTVPDWAEDLDKYYED